MATEIEAKTGRPPVARRRFTLLDGMILVAATACGFALLGWVNSQLSPGRTPSFFPDFVRQSFVDQKYPLAGWGVMMEILPVAGAWTLALVPLRLRKPRPILRRLARQPGWLASCGFALGLALTAAATGGSLIYRGHDHVDMMLELWGFLPIVIGPAILMAWLVTISARRWKAEPSWIDRLGRVLGVFWIAMAIVGLLVGLTVYP